MSASEVIEPWPISAPGERRVTMPSGAMRTQALIARAEPCASASEIRRMPSAPSAMQNVSPPAPLRKLRREILKTAFCLATMALALPRGAFDGGGDTVVGPAAADVAVHVRNDLRASR